MDKSTIMARLREHEPELKAAGIEHLALYGSYARGTAIRGGSDVDVMADFDGTRKTLIGRVHLENASRICSVCRPISPTERCFGGSRKSEARVGSCL